MISLYSIEVQLLRMSFDENAFDRECFVVKVRYKIIRWTFLVPNLLLAVSTTLEIIGLTAT